MREATPTEPAEEPHGERSLAVAAPAPCETPSEVEADPAASEPLANSAEVPRGVLRELEKGFLRLDRLIARCLPDSLNPLLHTGAIAVAMLLVATVSGVVLLIWYKPSVHLAYASVEAMSGSPLGAGLLRSLHRYSSDGAMLFGAIHAARILLERRFGGARWLAWVTGASLIGLLWFIGWTGYWLVWDLRAQGIAVGTAKLLDVLPIFAEPLSRSFATDEGVNSLLFFVVFFIHMIVPLAMGIFLWLHIARLARPRFLANRPLSLWLAALLLLLCIAYPATSEAPARMTAIPKRIAMDWWFLFPLPLVDRLGAGALWALFGFGGALALSVPWWLGGARKRPASVVASRCNECNKCFGDCPYDAIQMIARTDGNPRYRTQASVIASKCVSCGICAGSCDTMGIGIDWFSSIEQRRRIGAWLKSATAAGERVHLAFACAESAGAGLAIDPESGRCDELPGYRVLRVPCAGWVQPLAIERAIRQGALGVLVVSCPPSQCAYREGAEWTRLRIAGAREPALRVDKLEAGQVQLAALDRTRGSELVRAAALLRAGDAALAERARPRALQALATAASLLVFAAVLGLASDFAYTAPRIDGSQLVVSLKHPGLASENCRDLTPEELAATPVHMRKPRVCERERLPVRLRVSIDGAFALERSVEPSGIWKDGNSVALERIAVAPGERRVRVEIGESADPDEWHFADERAVAFSEESRRVVVFDRVEGFTWH
ncbi:MAG TPA: hydrogenase iron-sulfur subunit [Myxococcota bacterium]|nr:hydrogenase iron-sulfur subunit [Myxococcota bacterium]